MTETLSPQDRGKLAAATKALEFVEDGMRLGLGTGSTAVFFVRGLAERVAREGMTLTCVPTSTATRELAGSLGLKVVTLDEAGWLDLVVDGADEFDPALNLIKGGGGALLQEKIVATSSDRMLVISDDSKAVRALGAFPLPLEVVQFGWRSTKAVVEDVLDHADVLAAKVGLRGTGDVPFVTDEGHYILDCHLGRIGAAGELAAALVEVPGVVETGLFVDIADAALVGYASGAVEEVEAANG